VESTDVYKLTLTPGQAEALHPILERQRTHRDGAIMAVTDAVFDATAGGTVIRLSAKWLPWREATRIVREITKAKAV
jgi:hypothetical protein